MHKHLLLWVLCGLLLACCSWPSVTGQCIDTYEPGCQLQVEKNIPQRHCIDPTKYWVCGSLNAKAELKYCGPNQGFDQKMNTCIPWIVWVWTPCIEPPSRPSGWRPCGN